MEKQKAMKDGYTIYENGEIYSPNGKKIKINARTGYVILRVPDENGKTMRKTISAGRFVYSAFFGEIPPKSIVQFKDGDITNVALDNLIYKTRKEYFKNYDWGTMKRFNPDIVEEIRQQFNYEERKKHGFCGAYAHPSYREMAEAYRCSISTIQKIVREEY